MTERRIDLNPGERVIVRGPDAPGRYVSVPSITLAEGDTAVVSVTTPPPPPEPTPPPPSTGASGIAIPPVKAGWKRVGQTDFDDDIPAGSWTGDKQGVMMGRASGTDTSKRGKYTNGGISQHDSLLDCRMWQDAAGRWMGCPMNKAPNPSNDSATAPRSIRVTECMKVDGPEAGWKIAHMVAKYGVVQGNEYDFPEAQFGASGDGSAFLHLRDGSVKRFAFSGKLYGWHIYAIEVVSGVSVQVELDGQVIGRVTSGVTTDPIHWILQNETAIGGTLPAQMGEAHVLIDWVTVDMPA